jgi:hypothetical protein
MRFGTGGFAAGVASGAAGLASAMLADMIRFHVSDDLSLPQASGITECPNINYELKRGQTLCWERGRPTERAARTF